MTTAISRTRNLAAQIVPSAFGVATVRGTSIDNAAGAVLLVVLLAGGLVALWRRWRMAALYAAMYGGAIGVWRFALVRFVDPIIDVGFVMMFAGAALFARRAGPRWRHAALAALLLYFAIGSAQVLRPRLRRAATCDHRRPYEDSKCWSAPDFALLQAAAFIRDSTPRDAILFASKEGAFYYLTGRQSINQRRAITFDSLTLAPFMRTAGSAWAIATRVGPVGTAQSRLLARACRDFDLVREFPQHTILLRLRDPALPREWGPACEALAYWRLPSRLRR